MTTKEVTRNENISEKRAEQIKEMEKILTAVRESIAKEKESPKLEKFQLDFLEDFDIAFSSMLETYKAIRSSSFISFVSLMLCIIADGHEEMDLVEKIVSSYFHMRDMLSKKASEIIEESTMDEIFKDVKIKQ
jgi:hypothetical protein